MKEIKKSLNELCMLMEEDPSYFSSFSFIWESVSPEKIIPFLIITAIFFKNQCALFFLLELVLLHLSLIDLSIRQIPDRDTLLCFFMIALLSGSPADMADVWFRLGYAAVFLLVGLYDSMGDTKLLAACSLAGGVDFASFVLFVAIGLRVVVYPKREETPFGPYLAAGIVSSLYLMEFEFFREAWVSFLSQAQVFHGFSL